MAIAMQQGQQVSVCAVLSRPSKYQHRLLRIPAEILVAGPHGAILLE